MGTWTTVAFVRSGGVAARFRRGRWRRTGIEWGGVLVHWVRIRRHPVMACTGRSDNVSVVWFLGVFVKPYR